VQCNLEFQPEILPDFSGFADSLEGNRHQHPLKQNIKSNSIINSQVIYAY